MMIKFVHPGKQIVTLSSYMDNCSIISNSYHTPPHLCLGINTFPLSGRLFIWSLFCSFACTSGMTKLWLKFLQW